MQAKTAHAAGGGAGWGGLPPQLVDSLHKLRHEPELLERSPARHVGRGRSACARPCPGTLELAIGAAARVADAGGKGDAQLSSKVLGEGSEESP